MSGFVLQRPVSILGWELRGALASGRLVRLVLDHRCDGVRVNSDPADPMGRAADYTDAPLEAT